MPHTDWEHVTLSLIHDTEREKRCAELAFERARQAIQEKEHVLTYLREALEHYRRKHDLPLADDASPIAEEEYGHLGPSEAVEKWASQHNGDVVTKDLARALQHTQIYLKYGKAYNAVYTVLKRNPHYQKINSGHYRQKSNGRVPVPDADEPRHAVTQEEA